MEKVYRLKIEIRGAEKEISRTVEVLGETTLHVMNQIIQTLFGWEGYHLHEFFLGKLWDGEDITEEMEKKIKLKDIFVKKGNKIKYLYDFGDSWEHQIKVEKISDTDTNVEYYPNLISVERRAPDEDSGGVWGWDEICRVLTEKDRGHEMYEEYLEWMAEGDEEYLEDLYTFSEADFSSMKSKLKKYSTKKPSGHRVPGYWSATDPNIANGKNLELHTKKLDVKKPENVDKKKLDNKEIKNLIKLFKTDSFIPDKKVMEELLKKKVESEDYLLEELSKQLSRTESTMAKNYCYIFNLFIVLGEMESEKAFVEMEKVLEFKVNSLEKIFGDLMSQLRFPFEKIGKKYGAELYRLKDHVEEPVKDVIITILVAIYTNGGDKDKGIKGNLVEYIEETPFNLEKHIMDIFYMATQGFSEAEKFYNELINECPKKMRPQMLEEFKDLKKITHELKVKDITDLYESLEIMEGNKYHISKKIHENKN